MPTLILILASLFSVLLEQLFFLPIPLLIVVGLSLKSFNSEAYFFAFIAGLFLDVFSAQPLAGTSLFFLALATLIVLYKRKFDSQNIFFVFLTVLVSVVVYAFFSSGFTLEDFHWVKMFLVACFATYVWFFVKWVQRDETWS